MNTFCRWSLLASLLVTGLAQAQSTSSLADQIRPLLTEQLLAANAHDTDRFLASYVHSPELIAIENGQLIHGWDALREQQLKWWKNGKSDAVYTQLSPPEFAVLDSQTVVVTQQMASHRTLPDGSSHDDTFVVSTIWRHFPKGWRVTYSHESWARRG